MSIWVSPADKDTAATIETEVELHSSLSLQVTSGSTTICCAISHSYDRCQCRTYSCPCPRRRTNISAWWREANGDGFQGHILWQCPCSATDTSVDCTSNVRLVGACRLFIFHGLLHPLRPRTNLEEPLLIIFIGWLETRQPNELISFSIRIG